MFFNVIWGAQTATESPTETPREVIKVMYNNLGDEDVYVYSIIFNTEILYKIADINGILATAYDYETAIKIAYHLHSLK